MVSAKTNGLCVVTETAAEGRRSGDTLCRHHQHHHERRADEVVEERARVETDHCIRRTRRCWGKTLASVQAQRLVIVSVTSRLKWQVSERGAKPRPKHPRLWQITVPELMMKINSC